MSGKQTHDPNTLNTAAQNVLECVRGAQQIAQYAGTHCSLEGAFGFLLQPLQPIHNNARDAVMNNLYGLGDALVSVSQGILDTLASVEALEEEIRCHCEDLASGIGDGGGFGGGSGGGFGGGSGGGPSGGGGAPVAPPPAATPETPQPPAPVIPDVGEDPKGPDDGKGPDSTDPDSEKDPDEKDPSEKDPDEKDPEGKDPDEKDPEGKDPEEKDPEEKDPDEKDPEGKDPDEKDPDGGEDPEPKPGVEGHPLGCRCAGCDVHPAGCQCVLCLGEAAQPGCPPTCTACAGGVAHVPILAYDHPLPAEVRNTLGDGREVFAARWAEREPIVVVRESERLGASLGEAAELPGAIPSALDSVVTAAYSSQEGALR